LPFQLTLIGVSLTILVITVGVNVIIVIQFLLHALTWRAF